MKRGQSNLSLVIGIEKSAGHSSHSALGKLKRALGESRVGHAGTLDPFATGVLVALIGPAARLNRYIVLDDKSYVADMVLGRATDTDDLEGETVALAQVGEKAWSAEYAQSVLDGFTGDILQLPPTYSAIKRDGKKACDEARAGRSLEVEPRPVSIARAELLGIDEVVDAGRMVPCWRVAFDVSKGTYIRSLARDIGMALGCGAHLSGLVRTKSGVIGLGDCIPEDSDAESFIANAIDPMRLLGFRGAFMGERHLALIANGSPVAAHEVELFDFNDAVASSADCCISPWTPSADPLADGERVAMLSDHGLKAIYAYDAERGMLRSECVFQREVLRGIG